MSQEKKLEAGVFVRNINKTFWVPTIQSDDKDGIRKTGGCQFCGCKWSK